MLFIGQNGLKTRQTKLRLLRKSEMGTKRVERHETGGE